MAITVSLVEATPDRLMYLASQDDQAGASVTIPNVGGATPDLLTDIQGVGTAAVPDDTVSGIPLLPLINAGRNGYGPFAAGAVPSAERIFGPSDPPAGNPPAGVINSLIPQAYLDIRPRTGGISWAVVATLDGGNNPQIRIDAEQGTAGTAYVLLHFIHTKYL
jgi:hypothetical protein